MYLKAKKERYLRDRKKMPEADIHVGGGVVDVVVPEVVVFVRGTCTNGEGWFWGGVQSRTKADTCVAHVARH